MNALYVVIYYDGNYVKARTCHGGDPTSTDPTDFGLPATYTITAVIETPDVDLTRVYIDGEPFNHFN